MPHGSQAPRPVCAAPDQQDDGAGEGLGGLSYPRVCWQRSQKVRRKAAPCCIATCMALKILALRVFDLATQGVAVSSSPSSSSDSDVRPWSIGSLRDCATL